jgi:hypothetical protein
MYRSGTRRAVRPLLMYSDGAREPACCYHLGTLVVQP